MSTYCMYIEIFTNTKSEEKSQKRKFRGYTYIIIFENHEPTVMWCACYTTHAEIFAGINFAK